MSSSGSLPPLFDEFPSVSPQEWLKKVQADLGTEDVENVLQWESVDGVTLPAYVQREDLESAPPVSDRALLPPSSTTDDSPNGWQVRQNLRHPDPTEAASLAQTAVENGCSDLGLVLDPCTPNEGLQLESPGDLSRIFQSISLNATSLHLDRGPGSAVLAAAIEQGERSPEWSGTIGYDPVAALATGTVRETSTAFDLTESLLSSFEAPSVRSVSVDLRPYHDAGASAVQELCYGLGALSEILAQLSRRGIALSTICPHLQILVSCSTSYFVEIAKLRALRLLIPQVVDAYAADTDEALEYAPSDLFVQAETSRRTETLYDPHVNMLRGTSAAMAAVIGGCDVLSVRPYDASLRPSDAFGNRIARNVQLILRDEAHFDRVADPAAGAYYVEAATDQLAQRAWSEFQSLENAGGLLQHLQDDRVQNDIRSVREKRRQNVYDRARVLVGTNHYPNLEETRLDDIEVSSPCNNGTKRAIQLENLSLEGLQAALDGGTAMFEVLEGLQAPSPDIEPLPRIRMARGFERLRLRTERFAAENDGAPIVFLAPLGPPGPRSARATFARNFFGVAGFEVHEPLKFETPRKVADTAANVAPDVLVVCSADAEYPALVPAVRNALTDKGLDPLLVVAAPPSDLDGSVSADEFIHRGAPLYDTLERFQNRLGVSDTTPREKR